VICRNETNQDERLIVERRKPQDLFRMFRALAYSWQGLKAAWREERAFREEVLLAVAVIPAGIYFGRSGLERAALIAPMFLVLIIELLNSGLEAIVDRDSLDRDRLAGMAKDVGSAAVLLSLALLAVVWILVLSG
jgi:diacylglycerol kinase (ATP)